MGCLPFAAVLSRNVPFLESLLSFVIFHTFLTPSLATIAGYWLWFLYLKYLKMESEASKEVKRKCTNVNQLEMILLFENHWLLNRFALSLWFLLLRGLIQYEITRLNC